MVDLSSDERLLRAIELMYFAYRGFTSHADKTLERMGLTRVHHRVLYFIGRQPNQTVGQLLETLAISKQALSAPLRQLIAMDLVESVIDQDDRRLKRLSLSEKGRGLEAELTRAQSRHLEAAFQSAGLEDTDSWFRVMGRLSRP